MDQYSFEKLKVWCMARKFVSLIYEITSTFPSEEKYGLVSQLRRSAVSVCSNIAEGSSRWHDKDKARFYEMAFSSLIECLNQLIIGSDQYFVTTAKLVEARDYVDNIGRMLDALYKSALPPDDA